MKSSLFSFYTWIISFKAEKVNNMIGKIKKSLEKYANIEYNYTVNKIVYLKGIKV